ncbi:nuclear transport factor 2 family protein [Marinicauda algicola]|uniref:Nuclear transport factor 2 family protein n=1 Tax=Marinicauda algicola TaxID=2029849 RepID=A0A4S2H1C6_9PROT|nr:nuclear transport factor 2 family protein [Marinicauda algicola]TGY88972.1 nuclear transport factor 2 family protein [Marinicauda algicola]
MLSDDDRRAILDLQARWLEAEIAGDLARVGALLTEDCRIYVPDGAMCAGREAVLCGLEGPFAIRDVRVEAVEMHGGPRHAWKSARFTTVFDDDGRAVTITGHHVWLLRRSDAGWRVAGLSYEID